MECFSYLGVVDICLHRDCFGREDVFNRTMREAILLIVFLDDKLIHAEDPHHG